MTEMKQPVWGNDPLTAFFQRAFENRQVTFARNNFFKLLIDLDTIFDAVLRGIVNPENQICVLLAHRGHSAFRACCEYAASGQLAECFPLLRSVLEYYVYALHISQNPKYGEVWVKRHDSKANLEECRKKFEQAKLKLSLSSTNLELEKMYKLLYQRTIDFGAHPNVRAVTGNMKITNTDDAQFYETIYLHKDGLEMDHALKTSCEVALFCLEISSYLFQAKFNEPQIFRNFEKAKADLGLIKSSIENTRADSV